MAIMLDFSISDATALETFLERTCCGDTLTHECSTHFLTPDLIDQLRRRVAEDRTATTAKIIAELAKHKSCREFMFDNAVIEKLVGNLGSLDEELLFQTCRALANLCYDFDPAAVLVIQKGALDSVSEVLRKFKFDTEDQKQIVFAAAGLLCNLMTDDCKDIHFLPGVMRDRLLDLIRGELDAENVTKVSHRIMTVFVNLATCTEDKAVFSPAVCRLAVDLLKVSKDPEFYNAALTYLGDSTLEDEVKLRLAEAGLFDFLIIHVDDLPADKNDDWNLVGQVMTNIMAGEEALKYVTQNSCPRLLDRVTDWLNSGEYNHIVLAAKCILNYACSEEKSLEIVKRDLHIPLLAALRREDCDQSMLYAVLGCLRNIAIPTENKKCLIAAGILEALDPLKSLEIQLHVEIIFQLLNVWRKLIQAGQPIAIRLGLNKDLVAKLVEWSEAGCPWIMYEAPRLLCGLIVKSKDRSVITNLLSVKAFPEIIKLLTSEHEIMQIEAVNAVAVSAMYLLEQSTDWDSIVIGAKLGNAIATLITTATCLQLMENILSMLEIVFKYDKVKLHLNENNVLGVLSTVVATKEVFSSLLRRVEELKKVAAR